MRRLSHHYQRSRSNKHRHILTRRTSIKRIIHINIRPKNGILSININFLQRKSQLRSNSNHINSDTDRDLSTNSFIKQSLISQQKNKKVLNVSGSQQQSQRMPQFNRKTYAEVRSDKSFPQIHTYLQPRSTSKLSKTITKRLSHRKGSSRVAPYHGNNMSIDYHNSTRKKDAWFDDIAGTTDHHQRRKRNTNIQKFTWCCAIACIVSILIITIALVITLPIVLLTRQKAKTNVDNPALRWNSAGITIIGTTSQSGNTSSQLYLPWDIAIDWSYTLYVSDQRNHRLQKFLKDASSGTTVAGYGNGTGDSTLYGLSGPLGMVVDDNSNVYVSDTNNHRVVLWSNHALSGTLFAGNGTSGTSLNQLYTPYGIAYDAYTSGIYIAEYNNNRVTCFFPHNVTGKLIAGGNGNGKNYTQLSLPHAIYLDTLYNSLIIVNTGAHNIVRWVLGANNWTLIAGNSNGTGSSTSTALLSPTDVTLDPMGNMYVVDRNNHRIQFFPDSQSNAITIFGTTGIAGNNATLLNTPSSLVLDNQLNIYVVDRVNHRIQKFLRY